MQRTKNLAGFMFNKSVVIIVILVILAIIVIPKFFHSSEDKALAEKGVVGGVRVGVQTYFAQHKDYPATLDSAVNGACASANICFATVLSRGGITANWKKAGFTYTGPNGGAYTYVPAIGSFK